VTNEPSQDQFPVLETNVVNIVFMMYSVLHFVLLVLEASLVSYKLSLVCNNGPSNKLHCNHQYHYKDPVF